MNMFQFICFYPFPRARKKSAGQTEWFSPFILSSTIIIIIIPSDEEIICLPLFCGASLGIVFLTTKFYLIFYSIFIVFCNTNTIRRLSERLFHGCVRCIFLPGKSVAPDFRLLIFPYFAAIIYYIGYEKLFVFVPGYYFWNRCYLVYEAERTIYEISAFCRYDSRGMSVSFIGLALCWKPFRWVLPMWFSWGWGLFLSRLSGGWSLSSIYKNYAYRKSRNGRLPAVELLNGTIVYKG